MDAEISRWDGTDSRPARQTRDPLLTARPDVSETIHYEFPAWYARRFQRSIWRQWSGGVGRVGHWWPPQPQDALCVGRGTLLLLVITQAIIPSGRCDALQVPRIPTINLSLIYPQRCLNLVGLPRAREADIPRWSECHPRDRGGPIRRSAATDPNEERGGRISSSEICRTHAT